MHPGKTKKSETFINHCDLAENLYVLPYVSGRIVFAALLARALEEGCFDQIVLDLPPFLRDEGLLDTIVAMFPLVATLVIDTGEGQLRTLCFSPADAPGAALSLVRKARDEGGRLEAHFIDDTASVLQYPLDCIQHPCGEPPDDGLVAVMGLSHYMAMLDKRMAASWAALSDEQHFYWDYRSRLAAERLCRCLSSAKRTLLVCEHRLWRSIREKLIAGDTVPKATLFNPRARWSAVLVYEDPLRLWAKCGVLDDYPAVCLRFYAHLKTNKGSFDKLGALDEEIKASMQAETTASIRGWKAFHQYLGSLLHTQSIMTPSLDKHLYPAAKACLGGTLARGLGRQLMNYPSPVDWIHALITFHGEDCVSLSIDPELPPDFQNLLENALDSPIVNLAGAPTALSEKREQFFDEIHPYLNTAEADELFESEDNAVRWTLEQQYKAFDAVNSLVKRALKGKKPDFRTLKSYGSLRGPIDWMATLRSRSQGDADSFTVRRVDRRRRESHRFNDPLVPTLFLLDTNIQGGTIGAVYNSNAAKRRLELQEVDDPALVDPSALDFVFSIFYIHHENECFCDGHISRMHVSAILFLCTDFSLGDSGYKTITSNRPVQFQCRTMPEQDSDLADFTFSEKLAACGIKYSMGKLILISASPFGLTEKLSAFAAQRAVAIDYLPLSSMPSEAAEKLSWIYLISTPLKKHSRRDDILKRFAPELFGR